DRVELLGGEPLLHPEIVEIVKEILKYKGRFDLIRITTNCTIVPSQELIEVINNSDCIFDFILDDYGKYSVNFKCIQELFDKNGIPYRTDVYHGENQRFEGWIHFGDFTFMDYTEEELENVKNNCICVSNAFRIIHRGKLYPCVYAFCGAILQKVPQLKDEYIDLFDETMKTEKKREIAQSLGTNPIEACKYCKGFDCVNSPRFPAAEQLPYKKGGYEI
ncbi:MAG: hypothetical protein M1308_17815, partial [Actinobacteria bacterium]|nr:hypothetical protein [Actinomycetota bacterium]